MENPEWIIKNIQIYDNGKSRPNESLYIKDSHFRDTKQLSENKILSLLNLDLKGLYALPAFINGHDKCMATYHQYKGLNAPYKTWLEWDNELKSSPLFRERMQIDIVDLYRLASYRNIICGVGTVLDFIPAFVRENMYEEVFPSLLRDFGIAHSLCSYSLSWGEGIKKEYEYAENNDLPFCIHIAEGSDTESQESLRKLDELGALGEHTVLMHGLYLSQWDLDLIARKKASLIWSPHSNQILYNKTLPIKEAYKRGINIALGTDTAMNGSIHFLDDLKYAWQYIQDNCPDLISESDLLKFTTQNAASALRLKNVAKLENNYQADFFILKKLSKNLSIVDITLENIFLVVKNGLPIYGDESLKELFKYFNIKFDKLDIKGEKRLVAYHKNEQKNGILKLISRTTFAKNFTFLPIDMK